MYKCASLAIAALIVAWPQPSSAQYIQQDLFSFQATNQSMWGGSGPASASYQTFVGVQWDTQRSIGGIVGSEHTVIVPGGCIWIPFVGRRCWGETTGDTRTGAKFTATTEGRIGLDLGASITSGSVDVEMPGRATVSTASLTNNAPGSTVTIQTGYAVSPTAALRTEFPSLELYADFVFDVYAGGKYEACFIGAGCSTGEGTLFDVDATVPLASLNRDGDGAFKVLGQPVGLETTIGPVSFALFPSNLQTEASAPSTALHSSGDANFLSMGVDVPALIADYTVPGSSVLLSGERDGFSYTVLSASLGPRFGIGQAFSFTSTPMTTLSFSAPVSPVVGGVSLAPTLSFDAPLGASLDFVFPDALTLEVTPTYWLQNSLSVHTDFLSRLGLEVEVLSLEIDGLGSLGPLFEADYQPSALSVPIGIDDRTFSLAFNAYEGATFELTAGPATTPVPEPTTWLLLGCGLAVIGALGRRKRFD